jgi:hypothetical protein
MAGTTWDDDRCGAVLEGDSVRRMFRCYRLCVYVMQHDWIDAFSIWFMHYDACLRISVQLSWGHLFYLIAAIFVLIGSHVRPGFVVAS